MTFQEKKSLVGWILSILLLVPLIMCIESNNGWGILLVIGIWLGVAFITSGKSGGGGEPRIGGPFST